MTITLLILMGIVIGVQPETKGLDVKENTSGNILYSTPESIDLVDRLVKGFNQEHPDQPFQVISLSDESVSDPAVLKNHWVFSMDHPIASGAQQPIILATGREIVVPVISTGSTALPLIEKRGLTRNGLISLIESGTSGRWSTLLPGEDPDALRLILPKDPAVIGALSRFTGIPAEKLEAFQVSDADRMLEILRSDPNRTIGFCGLNDCLENDNQGFVKGITLVPVDKNGSGQVEYMENIYQDGPSLIRGAWIGKYPRELTHTLYCTMDVIPQNQANVDFINWVLMEGQPYLTEAGLTPLNNSERQAGMAKIVPPIVPGSKNHGVWTPGVILLFIAGGILIVGIIISFLMGVFRLKKNRQQKSPVNQSGFFAEKDLRVPGGLYYDKTHTWAFLEQDGYVKVGLNDFLNQVVGPVSRIEMKNKGEKVHKGDILCTLVKDGKHLNIPAPVSGTVMAVNESLTSQPGQLTEDSYSLGWIYQLEPVNWGREISFLSMAESYKTWLHTEYKRLKDFLGSVLQRNLGPQPVMVMQEGGALHQYVLQDFGPEVWEDFQTTFLSGPRS